MKAKYSAVCAVWYTSDGRKIYHPATFKSDWIDGYRGLGGIISRYKQDNLDPDVWMCPVFPVTRHGKHHGYYRHVNGSIGRCSDHLQGETASAKKWRLKKMNTPQVAWWGEERYEERIKAQCHGATDS